METESVQKLAETAVNFGPAWTMGIIALTIASAVVIAIFYIAQTFRSAMDNLQNYFKNETGRLHEDNRELKSDIKELRGRVDDLGKEIRCLEKSVNDCEKSKIQMCLECPGLYTKLGKSQS